MTAQGLRELLVGDRLTDRELEALEGAARDETAGQTAERLHLAPETVRMHRKMACAKLDARGVTRAVVVAISVGALNLASLVDD